MFDGQCSSSSALAWETSNITSTQQRSQLHNMTIWCLFCVVLFAELATGCFWCVFCSVPGGGRQTDVSVFSHNKTGWAEYTVSEVAARKCSHHLQGLRLCRLHRQLSILLHGKTGPLFDMIHQLSINPLASSSGVCQCSLSKACLGGIGCIRNLIKGVKKPPKCNPL